MPTTIVADLRINTAGAYRDIDIFKSKLNRGISQPLGRISSDAAEFSKSLQAAAARVTAFGAITGGILAVNKAISAAARSTIEVNKQLVELNTFLGESQQNLDRFGKSLFNIARATATNFSDVAEAAKEFARQGLSTEETLKRTNDALVLSRVSGLNYAQSVNSITTAINGFNKEALSSTEIISKLIAVDSRFAVSAAQLSEALTRVGSSAEESGLSFDELVATITTAQQITGRGGAVIGNALKTIFTRVRRPEILDQLRQLGVVVEDQNGVLLNGIQILKNYSEATKNLSQAEKSRTAELLGGVYQINQLQAVIRDLSSANSIYSNSLKISISATDEAIKKNEQLNKSYSALISQTAAIATQVGSDLGKNLFGPLITGGTSAIQFGLKLLSPEKFEEAGINAGQAMAKGAGQEITKGLSNALGNFFLYTGGPVLATIGAGLGIKLIKFIGASLKTQAKEITDPLGRYVTGGSLFGEKERERLALQTQISGVMQRISGLTKDTATSTYNEARARKQVFEEIKRINLELQRQVSLSRVLASDLRTRGYTDITQLPAARSTRRPRRSASGYIPNFATSMAAEEVSQAKNFGAKNPVPKLINATIKGKTQPVMVNSEEDVIPNFAGTGETAIIPRYRKMKDIPRMSKGYIPNFSQEISSAETSLNQVPGLFKKFGGQLGPRNIDIGGGKYDTGTDFLAKKFRIKSRVYDPYNRTKEFNEETLKDFFGSADSATIANVLNVIKEGPAREDLLKFISKSIKPKGSAFFGIYEGNKSGIGAPTSKGYQRNLPASGYLEEISKYFDIKKKTGNYIIGSPLASGYVPNFAKKDKYKFPSISSAEMEANIAKNFEKLSPENQKYFARAYEDYNNLIKVFSKASGTSPEKFASVMSALSPANPLERNALDALRYNLFTQKKLSTIASPIFLDEREIASVTAQTYGANRLKAANLLVGLENLTGNKRKAFVNNMLDPFASQDVTVDYRAQGDALNKEFNVKNAPSMNREQYDKVSQAFRNVGARAGVSGLGVQAATWIGGRMGTKDAKGQNFNRGILKFFYDNPNKISLENLEFLLNVPQKAKARRDFFKKAAEMGVSKLGPDSLISISRANGYIPNFAGLSDAINREKMMTGLPASQIIFHFDGKGNPTAVTNKRDEPNGLKDIVPNFARPSLPRDARGRFTRKTIEASPDSESASKDFIRFFLQTFGLAGVTSILNELYLNERIGPEVNTALQVGIPLLGGILGARRGLKQSKGQPFSRRAVAAGVPIGVGLAQGGLNLLSSGQITQDIQRRKLEKEIDASAREFKSVTEGTQELVDTLSKLDAAFKDASTAPEQLIKLSKRESELVRNLSRTNPGLSSKLASEPNLEKRIEIIEDARRKATRQQTGKEELVALKSGEIRTPEELNKSFSRLISTAGENLFKFTSADLKPENFEKIAQGSELEYLLEFFNTVDKTTKDKLLPLFLQSVDSEIKFLEVNKQANKKISEIRGSEIKQRAEIDRARELRSVRTQALGEGINDLSSFASQFGPRAAISFGVEADKMKKSLEVSSSFKNLLNLKATDKDLKLPRNISEALGKIEKPSDETTSLIREMAKDQNLNEKQRDSLEELAISSERQTKQLEQISKIAEINKEVQLKVLKIQEKLSFAGGIKTSTDAASRIASINAPLTGALQYRLGSMLGSERSQVSGLTNLLKSIQEKYPGMIDKSVDLKSVTDRLVALRTRDLQKDLFRDAGVLQSVGLAGTANILRTKATDTLS